LIEEYIDDKLQYGWAAGTINWDLINFRSFCYFAIEEGYPVPHTVTRVKDLAIPQRLPRPLPDEQVRQLEQCIQEAISQAKSEYQRQLAIRDLAFFYLMWHCGLRVGEVSELLVSDVDLRGKKIFIHDSKERKDRMLYMSPTTATALQHHLEVRKRQDSAYVFTSQHRVLTPRGIRGRLKKYSQECGIPVTPHRLRHTFASQMLAAGMSVTSLQRYLGHEDLDTTMIYAQVSDPMLQRDYYRGAATFDPASADLARTVLTFSEREELRQLITELKDSELDSVHRREILEQMETVLDESD
jgi:site-specific recombinase XerD